MKELVEFIIKNLVANPDAVEIREEQKDRETVFVVKVDSEDFGKIIGRSGKVATAIRTVVILFMSWAMVFIAGSQHQVFTISAKNWWFLIASG